MPGTAPLKVGDRVEVHLTYDDYCALPSDGRRYQILGGKLDVTPAPSSSHQRLSANFEMILRNHVKGHKLGAVYDAPIDVILAKDTIVQPDILFVKRERLEIITERGVEGPPDLIVEILSPSTRRIDRTTKMIIYAEHGVGHYWLVDPDARTLEIFELTDDAYTLRAALDEKGVYESAFFDGLRIEVAEIFAEDI